MGQRSDMDASSASYDWGLGPDQSWQWKPLNPEFLQGTDFAVEAFFGGRREKCLGSRGRTVGRREG